MVRRWSPQLHRENGEDDGCAASIQLKFNIKLYGISITKFDTTRTYTYTYKTTDMYMESE